MNSFHKRRHHRLPQLYKASIYLHLGSTGILSILSFADLLLNADLLDKYSFFIFVPTALDVEAGYRDVPSNAEPLRLRLGTLIYSRTVYYG